MATSRCSTLLALVVLWAAAAAPAEAPADRPRQGPVGPATTRAVLVAGLGGTKQYSRILLDWITRLCGVLTKQCGLKGEQIVVLAETADPKAAPPRGQSTAKNLRAALETMAKVLRPKDQLLLFLAGQGQISEEVGKLCLPGADIKATELGDLIDGLGTEQIVIVNTASGGADFLKSYLRPGRVIITAAGYETEGTQTYFAEFFVRGFETGRADANKDKAIDMLEAYVYAARETANFYHRQYLLESPDLGRGVKAAPGKIYWLVRGKETRAIWRKLYAGTDNILARPHKRRNDEGKLVDDLPANLDAEPDTTPKFGRYDKHWHYRRILAEHARLDDNGKSKEAFFLWKPYKFEKVPADIEPGQTGFFARRTVLGRPLEPAKAAGKTQPK